MRCVYFSGPEGTCFEGGVFTARLTFPADYPLSPPKMKFTCDLFHPNSMSDLVLQILISVVIKL